MNLKRIISFLVMVGNFLVAILILTSGDIDSFDFMLVIMNLCSCAIQYCFAFNIFETRGVSK